MAALPLTNRLLVPNGMAVSQHEARAQQQAPTPPTHPPTRCAPTRPQAWTTCSPPPRAYAGESTRQMYDNRPAGTRARTHQVGVDAARARLHQRVQQRKQLVAGEAGLGQEVGRQRGDGEAGRRRGRGEGRRREEGRRGAPGGGAPGAAGDLPRHALRGRAGGGQRGGGLQALEARSCGWHAAEAVRTWYVPCVAPDLEPAFTPAA